LLRTLLIIPLLMAGCTAALVPTYPAPTARIVIHTPTAPAPDIGITLAVPPTPTLSVLSAEGCPPSAAAPIHYSVEAAVDLPHHLVSGTLIARFVNRAAAPLSTLLMRVPLNNTKGVFTLTALRTEPESASYGLNGVRLEIILREALRPGCAATVTLAFRVVISPIPEGAAGGYGYFGYTDRQTNLGDWLPAFAAYHAGAWLFPKDWTLGETAVADAASYNVRVAVNHATSPARLEVAGPGDATREDATTWTFALEHSRNFAISISDSFIKETALTPEGVAVDLYHYALPGSTAPAHALATARDALATFTTRFGPAPYKRLAVVQGDFPDGMEFTGIVFVSTRWFTMFWEGKPDTWLTVITAHEVAHQWWYSAVGNDQSRTPYLDESFAIYSEVVYLEAHYPDLVGWWWKWRVEQYKPSGYVDATVYEFTQARLYINAVYLRGAQMLQEIRGVLGDEAFFGWLRDYAAQETDRIATPAALWGLLSQGDYVRTGAIRAKYLAVADPLAKL